MATKTKLVLGLAFELRGENNNVKDLKTLTYNVKDLKAVLANFPDDFQVVLSRDEEGNGFRPLYTLSAEKVVEQGRFGLELGDTGKPDAVVMW